MPKPLTEYLLDKRTYLRCTAFLQWTTTRTPGALFPELAFCARFFHTQIYELKHIRTSDRCIT